MYVCMYVSIYHLSIYLFLGLNFSFPKYVLTVLETVTECPEGQCLDN